MIPLAQYLNDLPSGEEFMPLRAVNRGTSRPVAGGEAAGQPVSPGVVKAFAPRSLPLAAVPSFEAAPRAAEPSVALSTLEAERETWAAERARLEAALEAAREEGERAGRDGAMEEAGRRADELSAELAASHAADIAAERDRWTGEQADRLADLMILQMAVFEDTMRATVKSVLRPLAMDARQRQALEDLAQAVKVISADQTGFRIAATGPSDLLTKLREKLGEDGERLSVRADESRVDLKVEADATTIETRLSAWGQALEKALA